MRIVTMCLAALALVGASGCGGGGGDTQSANDYVKQINKVQTDFSNSLSSSASTGTTSTSDPLAGAKQTFQNIDTGLTKVVSNLKAITPPDKVKDLHQQLITEISQLDQEVRKIAASVATGDLKKIAAAQANFSSAATRLQNQFGQTIDAINQKLQD
jgi:hypothetical protein